MRAKEFITENIELSHKPTSTGGVEIHAYVNGKEAGWVRFTKLKTGQVKAAMVHVPERQRRQGIGTAMYRYARQELGLDIVPSDSQTEHGRAFWNKVHENIDEAFDQPYHSEWEKSESGSYDVLAKLPDGSPLSIMFNNEGDDEWQVEFYRNNSQEVTGEGDAQRIFATVLNAMQKFIKEHKPWRLIFSASKAVEPGQNSESRAKLYDRLVQRYAATWGYDVYNEDHGDQVTYELTRLKQGVTENEKLTELFDQGTALPLEWERFSGYNVGGVKAKDELFATAYDKDGRTITISFVPMPNGIVDISFNRGGSMDITGKGAAVQIFATVVNAINNYIKAEKPLWISFSANEPSRAKLYQHMVKRLSGAYELLTPDQYPADEDLENAQLGIGSGTFFLLRKR